MKAFWKKEKSLMEQERDRILSTMNKLDPASSEYQDLLTRLKTLEEVSSRESEAKAGSRVSPDAVLSLISSLTGIGLILGHERCHVIATKAINFVTRGRLR